MLSIFIHCTLSQHRLRCARGELSQIRMRALYASFYHDCNAPVHATISPALPPRMLQQGLDSGVLVYKSHTLSVNTLGMWPNQKGARIPKVTLYGPI